MTKTNLTSDLNLAVTAAVAAGRGLAASFGKPQEVRYKSPEQPVTDADLEANRVIREILCAPRPGYGWLSEEMEAPASLGVAPTWVVDPLDGTGNFVDGRPEFAICIALLENGQPQLGVVFNPMSGVLYHATMGGGSFRDNSAMAARRYLGQRPALIVSSGEMESGRLDAFREGWRMATLGSTALKMMRVAEGGADAYVSRTDKGIWDVCAGSIIAEAAGATVRDLNGAPLDFSSAETVRGLIVVGRGGEEEIPRIAELARAG